MEIEDPNIKSELQHKLRKEYENIIKSKWKFLLNDYKPITRKHFHRTEIQEIFDIDNIKKIILEKIGPVAVFIFLTDFCNKFDIPGPYRNIDKALIVLYHMVCGVSINQMGKYMHYTNYFKIYKYVFVDKYDELNIWINNLMYNCFSNKNIRLLNSYIKNPELTKHVTLLMDGHHNKIVYENVTMNKLQLYSWKLKKPGLNTQFVIDLNEIVVFVSESLPCKDNNDDKMLINNVDFNKFFTIYDNMCFDGLYINTLLETIRKFSTRNLDINTTNFTYPINKEKNKKLEADEDKMNRYVAGFRSRIETFFSKLGQTFKRFSGDNNIRVTKLATYNIQLRLACVLMNIRQLSELADLDLQPKYTFWLNEKYDYPDINGITDKSSTVLCKISDINNIKSFQKDMIMCILHNESIVLDNNDNNIQMNNKNDDQYEVQYIYDDRIDENGKKEYLVKWKKYPKRYNSWVQEIDFMDDDIIKQYNDEITMMDTDVEL